MQAQQDGQNQEIEDDEDRFLTSKGGKVRSQQGLGRKYFSKHVSALPREAGTARREASHRCIKDASLDMAPYVTRITTCATAPGWELPETGLLYKKLSTSRSEIFTELSCLHRAALRKRVQCSAGRIAVRTLHKSLRDGVYFRSLVRSVTDS